MGHIRFLKNVTLNLKYGGVASYPIGRFAKVDKFV